MNIVDNLRNDLLTRNELFIELESSSNPNVVDTTKLIAEKMKVDESLVVLQHIRGNFGSNLFHVTALVYDNVAAKDKVEPRPRKKSGVAK